MYYLEQSLKKLYKETVKNTTNTYVNYISTKKYYRLKQNGIFSNVQETENRGEKNRNFLKRERTNKTQNKMSDLSRNTPLHYTKCN